MNVEHPSVVKLEKLGWTVVKVAFIALVLMLVLNPVTKGRAGFAGAGLETVLPARIKAAGLYSIKAGLAGTVFKLNVKPGDEVVPGQVLAEIENPDIEGLVERARRRMELAAARADQSVDTAQPAQRRWLEEQHASALRGLQAAEQRRREFSLADAEKPYARAQANAARIAALLAQQLATAREADDAQREADNELRNLNARREISTRLRQELEAAQSQVKMAKLQLDSAASSGRHGALGLLEARIRRSQGGLRNPRRPPPWLAHHG